ncbi:MAG: periplasmic heavy metal sensor [Planctomycetota bacterium]
MKTLNRTAFVSGLLAFVLLVSTAFAQSSDKHQHGDAAAPADLGAELRKLQGKVAELEAALATSHREKYGTTSDAGQPAMNSMKKMGGMGMGMMSGMKGMSQDSDSQMSGMGMGMMGKGMGGMGMMSMMKGKKGMMGMGMMGMNPAMSSDSMAGMDMPSSLPGFPGASHVYHIGQTGFFLDHPEHITLTNEQQKKLNSIKEASLLVTSTAEREIAEAEQELWKLTAADEPDIKKIEAKAKEIAQLQVKTRIAFIRSVGDAANVLTKEQRQILVGEQKK